MDAVVGKRNGEPGIDDKLKLAQDGNNGNINPQNYDTFSNQVSPERNRSPSNRNRNQGREGDDGYPVDETER